ncbi:MAG TPA: hypothetical protein VG326_00150 [Tepidisphaeraceae bacterium]|jgi:hypothetical protein|nr:hypothetical protein [Tepidisphaeraceae bacterium]
MSGTVGAILFIESSSEWRLAFRLPSGEIQCEVIPSQGVEHSARAVGEKLKEIGSRRAVVLALPPEFCLCATVHQKDAPSRRDRTALLFRLEESLPVAAEDVRVDFVFHDEKAFGVSALRLFVDPIMAALESDKTNIAAVCPAALLALHGAAIAQIGMLSGDLTVFQDGATTHVFAFLKGKPAAWIDVPSRPSDVTFTIASQIVAAKSAMSVTVINTDENLTDHIGEIADVNVVRQLHRPPLEIQLSAAEAILRGRLSPMLDLSGRRQQRVNLFSRQAALPTRVALAACVILSVCLSASYLFRANRYAALATEAQAEKEEVFRRVFPGQPIPLGIQSRLQSAAGRLKTTPSNAIDDTPDALTTFHEVLTHLPRDVRYNISTIDVEPGRLILEGQVRTHADADAIAVGLRRSPRFNIEDPQTQQLGSATVQFSIGGLLSDGKRLARKPE